VVHGGRIGSSSTSQKSRDIRRLYFDFANSVQFARASPLYNAYGRFAVERRGEGPLFDVFDGVQDGRQHPAALFAAAKLLVLSPPISSEEKKKPGNKHLLSRTQKQRSEYRDFAAQYSVDGDKPLRSIDRASGARLERFCEQFAPELRDVMNRRVVAVNDVGRLGVDAALLSYVNAVTSGPLALFEGATCRGAKLRPEDFSYLINGVSIGDPSRPQIESNIRFRPELWGDFEFSVPNIGWRAGADLCPIFDDPDDLLWMKACIWEGDRAREEMFDRVTEMLRLNPPPIFKADFLDVLELGVVQGRPGKWGGFLGQIPDSFTPVIAEGYVNAWMHPKDRKRLMKACFALGRLREFYLLVYDEVGSVPVFSEGPRTEEAYVGLIRFNRDGAHEVISGSAHPHGLNARLSLNHTRLALSSRSFRSGMPQRFVNGARMRPRHAVVRRRAEDLLDEVIRDIQLLQIPSTREFQSSARPLNVHPDVYDETMCLAILARTGAKSSPEAVSEQCGITVTDVLRHFRILGENDAIRQLTPQDLYELTERGQCWITDMLEDLPLYLHQRGRDRGETTECLPSFVPLSVSPYCADERGL
jgi:hypothetical protein